MARQPAFNQSDYLGGKICSSRKILGFAANYSSC
jgi:hypothetical protein